MKHMLWQPGWKPQDYFQLMLVTMIFKLFSNRHQKCAPKEEVYVVQAHGFEDPRIFYYVYKLKKASYGFKQAPRVWYEMQSYFLIENGFVKGKVDTTLFIRREVKNILYKYMLMALYLVPLMNIFARNFQRSCIMNL